MSGECRRNRGKRLEDKISNTPTEVYGYECCWAEKNPDGQESYVYQRAQEQSQSDYMSISFIVLDSLGSLVDKRHSRI